MALGGNVTLGRDRTFNAGADFSALQYTFVKLDTTQNQVLAATDATTNKPIGILVNAPKQNDVAQVTLLNGQGTQKIVASAAISIGASVTATTGGKAVTTTTGSDLVCGIALEAAAANGDIIEIALAQYKY